MKFNLKSFLPHIFVTLGFVILSFAYMSPLLNGKQLVQSDPKSFYAQQTELRNFQKETGQWTGWTNSMFGGMPTYFIGGQYSKSFFYHIQEIVYYLFGLQGTYIFLYLICAYILLMALRANLWASVFGSIAYGFYSLNILIIEAGHLAKIYALAFVPLMLAGAVLMYRRKTMWLGVALFGLGVGMEVNANHFQITYYSIFILLIFGLSELVRAIKKKQIKLFSLATVAGTILAVLAIATNTSRIWTTLDHTKYTNRGGAEYINPNKAESNGGLDKDYAYEWSVGIDETLTHLIPNFKGGASGGGQLGENSEVAKVLSSVGVETNQAIGMARSLPTYFGDQRFTGGPSYSGSVLLFLFVLGLVIVAGRYKIPFLISGLFILSMAWGGNFTILNDFWFDHLPMFSKFRAHSQATSLFQLCLLAIAALGLSKILTEKPSWPELKKPFLIALGTTAGLSLLFVLFAGLLNTSAPNDDSLRSSLSQSFGNNTALVNSVMNALMEDRAGLVRADAIRSLIFILLAAGLIWLFISQKIKSVVFTGLALCSLLLIDLWAIDKRYLNADDFQRKTKNLDSLFEASTADLQILQDKDPNFRVFDLSTYPFQNANTSYFHKSIGGYHTVKLRRYNELVENQIVKNNLSVLNMLNAKYFITRNQTDGTLMAQRNPAALGNAWFVQKLEFVDTPNQELDILDSLDVAHVAVVDRSFEPKIDLGKISTDTTGYIKLTDYQPNKLTYTFESNNAQTVVFSENYYNGNTDWISSIDSKEVDHFRANYVLRALQIPAGKHEIVFEFKPKTVIEGNKIDTITSWTWLLLSIGAIVLYTLNDKKKDESEQ